MVCIQARGAYPRADDEIVAVRWLSAREIRYRDDIPPFTVGYLDAVERYLGES